MIEFSNTAVRIFGYDVYYYGIILMLGVACGIILASYEAKRRGMDPEFLLDSVVWVVIAGIIGARLWHIFTPSQSLVAQGITTEYYLTHPLDALNIRKGGLGIPGAVIGGGLAFYIYCCWKGKGKSFSQWVDVLAPALLLGQAIGRWGNFFNQELYGAPTDLPWGIFISPSHRLAEYSDVAYYHPIFLYESLWNLATVFLLLWVGRKFKEKLLPGDLVLIYMLSYPTIRFLLEFLRLDSSQISGVNANQAFMVVVFVVAAGILIIRHKISKKELEVEASP